MISSIDFNHHQSATSEEFSLCDVSSPKVWIDRRRDVANSRWITHKIRSRRTCMILNVKCRLIDESRPFLRIVYSWLFSRSKLTF